jgi:hypothetical protein
MAATKTADLPTRVTVLEHGVAELKSGLDQHRSESRTGFAGLQAAIDRLIDKGAGQRTNWYLVAGFVVSIMTIVAGMVTVAEWRISQATAPFASLPERVQQIRIDIEKEKAATAAVEAYRRAHPEK